MEKVPLQDILESIRRELENLKSTESETSVYADVAIAGIGSTMNLIRCINTALATGADPRRVRQFVNTHLRRTMAADATAVQELAWVRSSSGSRRRRRPRRRRARPSRGWWSGRATWRRRSPRTGRTRRHEHGARGWPTE